METTDFPRFKELMTGMAKVYERETDALLFDAYWMALRKWPLGDFERAAAHLMSTVRKGMPRPADFTDLMRAGLPTAGEAWAAVLKHCRGAYRGRPNLDDGGPIDRCVAALGGYRQIAMTDTKYLGILERSFRDHYATQLDVDEARAIPMAVRAQVTRREGKMLSASVVAAHVIGDGHG